jgi:hypothetical protein
MPSLGAKKAWTWNHTRDRHILNCDTARRYLTSTLYTKYLNVIPAGSLPAFYATLVHLLKSHSGVLSSGVCCLPIDILSD